MGDPRLNGRHLGVSRRDQYEAAVDEMLDDRGPLTAAADPLARPPSIPHPQSRREQPPPGGTYWLVPAADGSPILLRVGITALGRAGENDVVVPAHYVSRRHCVVVVHANGGCEVTDTASRNGTRVNGRRVGRADLLPATYSTCAGSGSSWCGSDPAATSGTRPGLRTRKTSAGRPPRPTRERWSDGPLG